MRSPYDQADGEWSWRSQNQDLDLPGEAERLWLQGEKCERMQGAPEKKNGEDGLPIPPYAVYNIGGGQPENLLDYISTLQEELVRAGVLPADYDFEGHRELVGMQAGDVPVTYADSEALERDYGFTPKIGIREGLRAFAEWYAEYYR